MPELRTPVMIVVDASWQDERGILQSAKARLEDKSAGGACLRLKNQIAPGTKLKVQWRFDQFSGTVKYCRSDGREYLAGIQRDALQSAAESRGAPEAPARAEEKLNALTTKPADIDRKSPPPAPIESDLGSRTAVSASESPRRAPYEIDRRAQVQVSQVLKQNADRPSEISATPPARRKTTGSERKPMAHTWRGLMPWREKQGDSGTNGPSSDQSPSEKEILMPPVNPVPEKTSAHARAVPTFEVELLAMDDIYRAAGIPGPRKGYSVNKVVEMLNSEHIRNLSKEMKRAAVLMALDAAGVSIDQVQRDAKARQSALDTYESEQKKQAEAEWARKGEEITQIQAELESIKAHYMGRITRNQEAVARDKARFSNWVATKQQEAQSMSEALDLCLKSQPAEPVSAPSAAELSMAASAGLAAAPVSGKPQ
jgi:hypothetical protein